MFFQLTGGVIQNYDDPDHGRERWTWVLRQGSEQNPSDAIAASPGSYASEAAARSAVAALRKSSSGVKFAKVVSW